MEIERRQKTVLDESRLLILGAQVLFGFQFEAVFQELFAEIPASSRIIHCAGLVMLLISVGLLIAPSLLHQITFEHLFSRSIGIAVGTGFTIIALGFLYGLGVASRRDRAMGPFLFCRVADRQNIGRPLTFWTGW